MSSLLVPGKINLLWLEDRQNTSVTEIGEAKRFGCEVHVRAQPVEIVGLLEAEFGPDFDLSQLEKYRIAFIIDVMISGLLDLSGLGIPHSDTSGGLSGGYVFADRYLRTKDSPYRHRPICFLSERELTADLEEDLEILRGKTDSVGEKHGPVEFVGKFNSSELERFKKHLGSL